MIDGMCTNALKYHASSFGGLMIAFSGTDVFYFHQSYQASEGLCSEIGFYIFTMACALFAISKINVS